MININLSKMWVNIFIIAIIFVAIGEQGPPEKISRPDRIMFKKCYDDLNNKDCQYNGQKFVDYLQVNIKSLMPKNSFAYNLVRIFKGLPDKMSAIGQNITILIVTKSMEGNSLDYDGRVLDRFTSNITTDGGCSVHGYVLRDDDFADIIINGILGITHYHATRLKILVSPSALFILNKKGLIFLYAVYGYELDDYNRSPDNSPGNYVDVLFTLNRSDFVIYRKPYMVGNGKYKYGDNVLNTLFMNNSISETNHS